MIQCAGATPLHNSRMALASKRHRQVEWLLRELSAGKETTDPASGLTVPPMIQISASGASGHAGRKRVEYWLSRWTKKGEQRGPERAVRAMRRLLVQLADSGYVVTSRSGCGIGRPALYGLATDIYRRLVTGTVSHAGLASEFVSSRYRQSGRYSHPKRILVDWDVMRWFDLRNPDNASIEEGKNRYEYRILGRTHPREGYQDRELVYLQPWCEQCENGNSGGEERLWCEDDVWEQCEEYSCRCRSIAYVRGGLGPNGAG